MHVAPSILMDNETTRIDPDKWRPLILSFQEFYGLFPACIPPGSELFRNRYAVVRTSNRRVARVENCFARG